MNLSALLPHISSASAQAAAADPCAMQLAAQALEYQQQVESLRAQLGAEHDARLAELATVHQHGLQTAREEWCQGEAATLAASLAQQVDAAASALASGLHRILVPFATAAATKTALQDLCTKVQQAAASDLKAEIRLEGPADLVQALQSALGQSGFDAAVIGSYASELQARIGETRLLSHLPEWLAALKDSGNG